MRPILCPVSFKCCGDKTTYVEQLQHFAIRSCLLLKNDRCQVGGGGRIISFLLLAMEEGRMTWDEDSGQGVTSAMLKHKAGFPEDPRHYCNKIIRQRIRVSFSKG